MERIPSAEFIISAVSSRQFPDSPLPEVAFVGRSNVGKSSLLNTLVGRKKLAKTSSTPGKTRQINFFKINDAYHYVDLPGYGYAKVSKEERERWRKIIKTYLTRREQLRLVVSLVDIRHDPTALDRELFTWLESLERPFLIVLTKLDKISVKQAEERVTQLLELTKDFLYRTDVIPFSSATRQNRLEVFDYIERVLLGGSE